MTILAKSFSENKGDKLVVPLVENEQLSPPVRYISYITILKKGVLLGPLHIRH